MLKVHKFYLLIIIFVFITTNRVAGENSLNSKLVNSIKSEVVNKVLQDYPFVVTRDIEIVIKNLEQVEKIWDNRDFKVVVNPKSNIVGNSFIELLFFNKENKALKNVQNILIFLQVKVYGSFIKTSRLIKKGEIFTSNNINIKFVDIREAPVAALKNPLDLVDQEAVIQLPENMFITKTMFQRIPDIRKNAIVKVFIINENVVLNLVGEALDNGNIGDFVLVRIKDFKKILKGKIINKNYVKINFAN